ncbi:MAG: hypothetical protein AAB439_03790 [Patescibacteria group bacterium]
MISILFFPTLAFGATATVTATPATQYTQGAVTITWSSTDAWKCVGSGFSTGNAKSGSTTVYPSSSGVKTYAVTCYDETPACTLVQTDSYIEDAPGSNNCSTNISYSPAGSCSPNGGTCQSSTSNGGGTWTHRQFQCQGSCTTATASDTVTVNDPPPPPDPSVDLTVSPTTVTAGSSVLISWTSARATLCNGTNFSTGGNTSGSVTITPTTTKTYSITCDSEVYSATPGVWVDTGVTDVTDLWCSSGPPPPSYSNYYTNNQCTNNADPSGTACVGSQTCAVNSWSGGGGPNTYCNLISDLYQCNGGSAPNQITDTATVTYNQLPNVPTITAPSTGVTSANYTFSFRASDPDNNTVRYRVDWNNDGIVDLNLPASGYTTSNTLLSTLYQWATQNSYIVKARTQDSAGAQSGWTSHTITIGNPTPQCADGVNNDGDAYTDLADPGCADGSDTTESPNPQCSDGINNDAGEDVLIDYPNDYGCASLADTTESPNPQCANGLDDNGNDLIDLADVNACTGPSDGVEESLPTAALSFTASELVQPQTAATLTWSATDIESGSCSIAGTNGDSFSGLTSSGLRNSSALTTETIFTLSCDDLNGDPQFVQVTVKLVPLIIEI